MVSGLMEDTPLGRIVSIRCEKDRDIIKRFTKEQKQIQTEWALFKASKDGNQKEINTQFIDLEKMIAGLFGG